MTARAPVYRRDTLHFHDVPPNGDHKANVIFFQGYHDNLERAPYKKMLAALQDVCAEQEARLIAHEPSDHGRSAGDRAKYGMTRYLRDSIFSFHHHLGNCDKPTIIVGHSIGALKALLVAELITRRKKPCPIAGITAISPPFSLIGKNQEGYIGGLMQDPQYSFVIDGKSYVRSDINPDMVYSPQFIRDASGVFDLIYKRGVKAEDFVHRGSVNSVPFPIEIIYGDHDQFVPAEHVDMYVKRLPQDCATVTVCATENPKLPAGHGMNRKTDLYAIADSVRFMLQSATLA